MKLYSRICQIVEQDRKLSCQNPIQMPSNLNAFSFLDQKGPRSLNTISKKNNVREIENENQKIKQKIEQAKSGYSLKALTKHKKAHKQHRQILMQQSPTSSRLDPLIRKSGHDRSMFGKFSKNVSDSE